MTELIPIRVWTRPGGASCAGDILSGAHSESLAIPTHAGHSLSRLQCCHNAGLGNFRRGLISSPYSRPTRKSKSQPWCAWRMCSRYIFPYPRE